MIDQLPAHALETEVELVGCLLSGEADVVADCLDVLKLDLFYDLRHRAIAETVMGLAIEGKPATLTTVTRALLDAGRIEEVGGFEYLSACLDACVSPASWIFHHETLRKKFILRKLGSVCEKLAMQARDNPDPEQLLEDAERAIMEVRGEDGWNEGTMKENVLAVIAKKEDDRNGRPLRGLSTGFSTLDKWTRGLSPTQLIIIAARPAVGKTSLAVQIAERIATEEKLPVGIFSLESSQVEITEGILDRRARIQSQSMNEREMQSFATQAAKVGSSPIYFCDDGGITIGQLCAKARRWKQRHGIVLLVVDYIQLVAGSGKRDNRANEVGEVSRGLKRLAMDLKIPVIAVAQVNRDCEKNDRPPRMSDLRESGNIEADANIILMLHTKSDAGGFREVQLAIEKNRGGRRGVIEMVFNGPLTEFREADVIDQEDYAAKPSHNDP